MVQVNFVVYVWDGERNVAIFSTTDEKFSQTLKRWAEEIGYRVTVKNGNGSEHQ
ncbi:MAG TPA: hypothetical protein VJX72_10715 [Candidatus Acidoferrum sp.]|nr:hypothetical protein [Candidatus Acidoferrum sp.]